MLDRESYATIFDSFSEKIVSDAVKPLVVYASVCSDAMS